MRVRRFHLRSLMAAVGVIALLLVDFRVSYSWWAVRPLLYVVLIPLVTAILVHHHPPRSLIVFGVILSALLLLGWYELRRPSEWILVGGDDIDHVHDLLLYISSPTHYHNASSLFRWVRERGTLADVACLSASLLILLAMLVRAISFRTRLGGATSLALVALYDWTTSKTWGGTRSFANSIEMIPWHLAGQWVRGETTFAAIASRVGFVGGLELFVLIVVFLCLTTVALRAFLRRILCVAATR